MKTASIVRLIFAVYLSWVSGSVFGAGTNDVSLVGHLREFDRFTFRGNASFSDWSLWSALNSTFDFPVLSHPLAPRDAFLAAIESQLRLGYQHGGFPDVQVTARYDSSQERVIVQIREGQHYLCGPVELIGARKIPVPTLVKVLTVTNSSSGVMLEPFQFLDNAPANRVTATDTDDSTNLDCLWVPGQPAHFDNISLQLLARVVTNTLDKHGFLMTRFNLNVVRNTANRTATLQIRILEEGLPATIGNIEVTGNRRNSREAILDYLNLKPGLEFSSDVPAVINDRLYHSARFLTNSVSVGPPDSSGRLPLAINVIENDQCPPLNGKFEPMEQTMLKSRDWLARVGGSPEEAVATLSGYPDEACTMEFILAPRQGMLWRESTAVLGTNQLRHALILSSNQIAFYVPERKQKFVAHDSSQQLKTWATVETVAPEENGNCASLAIGANIDSHEDATDAPPCVFSISLAPAAFVRLAHTTNSACWYDGDQLFLSNNDSVLKLDARTGRLIELTVKGQEPRHSLLTFRFQPDAFEPVRKQIEHEAAGFENVYNTNAPFISGVAFFGSELVQVKLIQQYLQAKLPAVTSAQLPALLRELGTDDVFSSLESFNGFEPPPDGPAGPFQIPEQPRPQADGEVAEFLAAYASAILLYGDKVLPKDSWPWTLARDAAFISRQQTWYLLPDLAAIYSSNDCGPIGCLVTASMLKASDSPLAKPMAERGLERLSAEEFQRDYRLFLDEKTICGRFAAALAGTLRNLNNQKLEALLAPMPPGHAQFIRNCAARLRDARPGQPLSETIAPVLNDYWEKTLKQKVADSLQQIATK